MTDPTPDPETVRVTYAELAKARGVSIAAARKLVLRHRWPKQMGNDGVAHVVVPVSFMEGDGGTDVPPALDEALIEAIARATAEATTVSVTGVLTGALTDLRTVLPTLQEAITSLRVQLMAERDRAEAAERRAQAAEVRVQELLARRWWRWGR